MLTFDIKHGRVLKTTTEQPSSDLRSPCLPQKGGLQRQYVPPEQVNELLLARSTFALWGSLRSPVKWYHPESWSSSPVKKYPAPPFSAPASPSAPASNFPQEYGELDNGEYGTNPTSNGRCFSADNQTDQLCVTGIDLGLRTLDSPPLGPGKLPPLRDCRADAEF